MTNPELRPNPENEINTPRVDVKSEYEEFVPDAFRQNPLSYFETHGVNIKQGEILYDETGRVREDPTAVKDLPIWENKTGQKVHPVGKKVNLAKGKVAEAGDPFYEYQIMEYVQSKGLPGPKPIAKASEGDAHLIVMENVPGMRWSYRRRLTKQGWSDADVDALHKQGEVMMAELQTRFEEQGIIRGWKLSDMIFDIDVENKQLKGLVPVDWERTKIKP